MIFKEKRVPRLLALAVVVLLLVVVARQWLMASDAPAAPATVVATTGDIENTVLATGAIEAQRLVSVGAQVSGQLQSLKVATGDAVRQGDLLAEIDSMTQRNTVRDMEAQLRTVRAQRDVQVAARQKAVLAHARQKQLLSIDATSRQDYEAAQAELASVNAQIAALDAQIAQAEIAVDTAKVTLGYTQIVAPMDGTVVALVAQEGQTLNANQQTPTILKLARLDRLTVKAQISEGDVVRIKPGQPVYFTILGDPDTRYHATLRAVEPAPESIATDSTTTAATTSSGSSSSSAVYYNGLFEVDNPDGVLRISMTTQVYIVLDRAEAAVLVPSAAIGKAPDGGRVVQVLDQDGKLQERRVEVGIDNHIMAQIKSGLQAGERVVAAASGALAAGGSGSSGGRPPPPMGF